MASQRGKRVLDLHNAKARQGGGALLPVRARLEAGGLAVTVGPFENLPKSPGTSGYFMNDRTRACLSGDKIVPLHLERLGRSGKCTLSQRAT